MIESLLYSLFGYDSASLVIIFALVIKVLLCIAVFLIGQKIINWAVALVRRMLLRTSMQEGAATFFLSMLKIALYCVLVVIIAMQFGVTGASIAALIASVGVTIALGLQGGLSNLVGGVLILLFQPFNVGDYIIAQGTEGTVEKIEIMYTTLLTIDNKKAVLPNGTLANGIMQNASAADKRRLDIRVGISYGDDIAKAKGVLLGLVEKSEDTIKDMESQVFVAELGESSVVLGLRCWVPGDRYFPALWQMNEDIKTSFDEAGVHIPYPQMDVHVQKDIA